MSIRERSMRPKECWERVGLGGIGGLYAEGRNLFRDADAQLGFV